MQQPSIQIGWGFNSYSISGTTVLSSATTYLAHAFTAYEDNLRVTQFVHDISAIAGNPTAIECIVCAETSVVGTPNTANPLQSATIGISATGWATWTFSTPVILEKNRPYWIVIKGNSTSNYPTMRYMTQGLPYDRMGTNGGECIKKQCTDGASWVSMSTAFGYCIRFSDGTQSGYPYKAGVINLTSAGSEYGVRLVIPKDASALSVSSAAMTIRRVTSPVTWPYMLKVYINGSLMRVTAEQDASITLAVASTMRRVFAFSTPIRFNPGDIVDLTIPAGASATASNYYRIEGLASLLEGYPNPVPFEASSVVKSAAGVWTVDPTSFPFYSLGLTAGSEFLAPPLNRRTSTGR